MGATQCAAKTIAAKETTQFEITSDLLRNLYKFDLTPVTKLVLLELTTHLNESENGSVVFPSVGYVAEVLGIGLTACKKAINDLIKAGLIIKSKRDNIKGNYNKYLLRLARINFKAGKNENEYKYTKTDMNGQKTTNKPSENELFKQSDSDLFYIRTNNNEQIKQQTDGLNSTEKTYSSNKGGNVYSGDDEILADYAVKHKAKSVSAYIAKLKETGSAAKIIKEYKQKQFIKQRAENEYKRSQEQLRIYESYKKDAVPPETSPAWVELGKKIRSYRNSANTLSV